MKLNKLEFLLMNNPLRNLIQKYIEMKRLRKFSNLKKNKVVLEIGCGSGNGSRLIKKYFHPKIIYATDLDERMILRAKKMNVDESIIFSVRSATALGFKSNSFDAIFDLGVIHHIPNWKDCLKELRRVLKPGGQLIIEDLSTETFSSPFGKIMKHTLDHPYSEMHNEKEFVECLRKLGFKIRVHKVYSTLIRYLIIIAEK
jgi:ubiquinone/menaquinone biosynthesis C-methylase UbiE